MIPYNPKDAQKCWDAGEYRAVIASVKESTAKTSGNPMHVIVWNVHHPDGREQQITDYISYPAATWKVKRLADALGERAAFDAGTFDPAEFVGSMVLADVDVEKQDGYDDKNKIKKYMAVKSHEKFTPPPRPERKPAPSSPIVNDEFKEDDIPF